MIWRGDCLHPLCTTAGGGASAGETFSPGRRTSLSARNSGRPVRATSSLNLSRSTAEWRIKSVLDDTALCFTFHSYARSIFGRGDANLLSLLPSACAQSLRRNSDQSPAPTFFLTNLQIHPETLALWPLPCVRYFFGQSPEVAQPIKHLQHR